MCLSLYIFESIIVLSFNIELYLNCVLIVTEHFIKTKSLSW